MGGPCIILQKYEGGSHKTSLRKNEFFQPTPPPVLYDQSLRNRFSIRDLGSSYVRGSIFTVFNYEMILIFLVLCVSHD